MNLPKDPIMLLSVINTKLRDQYPSISALAEDLEVSEQEIKKALEAVGYQYNETLNRFQ